jgi:deazaflavin-dependent oxidoreductase (nitroreductase family)
MTGVFREFVRRAGHTRLMSRLGPLWAPVDRLIGRLTRGRVVALGIVPSLLLTTTGRTTGRPRCNALLCVADGDAFVVIGSNWGRTVHPAWVRNLLADPRATVTTRGESLPVRAHLVTGPDRARLWDLATRVWPAYDTYARRAGDRDIRVFRLERLPDHLPSE